MTTIPIQLSIGSLHFDVVWMLIMMSVSACCSLQRCLMPFRCAPLVIQWRKSLRIELEGRCQWIK